MRWTGHVECVVLKRNACRVLVGKPEGKRLIGRFGCEVNTVLCLKDTGWQCVDRINLAEDRDMWQAVVKKLWFPQNDGKFLSS
jgi:hypothetical protein